MKSLNTEIMNGSQSVSYKETLEHGGAKIRITIKSDSYDFQSYARLDRWNGEEWKNVESIHYSNMKTETKLAYMPPARKASKASFKADRDALIKIAKKILD